MARTLPVPKWDKVTDEKGLLSPKWVEYFEGLTAVNGFVFEKPTCHVYFSADQSIANATWTDLTFNAEDHDNANFHSTTTNTDRITIPEEGAYCVGAHVLWEANATGARSMLILRNTSAAAIATAGILVSETKAATVVATNDPVLSRAVTFKMNAGDILRVAVRQNSGGALDAIGVDTSGPQSNAFWCLKIANAVR